MSREVQIIVGVILLVFVILPLAVLAGAILLRAACALCRIGTPRFGKAVKVVILIAVVNGLVSLVLNFILAAKPNPFDLPARLALLVFLFLLNASIYAAQFEVSWGKGALIRLAEIGIVAAITLVMVGGVFAAMWTREWIANAPYRPSARKAQARLDTKQGEQAAQEGRDDEAARRFASAAVLWGQLATEFPGETDYRRQQAQCYTRQGELLISGRSRLPEIAAVFEKARAGWDKLAADFPDVPDYSQARDQCRRYLDDLVQKAREAPKTADELQEAQSLFKQMAKAFAKEPAYRHDLARCCVRRAALARKGDRTARQEAEQEYRDALALWKELAAEVPAEAEYRRELARASVDLGDLLRADPQQRKQATALFKEALSLAKPLVAAAPRSKEDRQLLASTSLRLGELVSRARQPLEAQYAYREAEALFRQLIAEFADEPEHREGLLLARTDLGILLVQSGQLPESLTCFQDAITFGRQLSQKIPNEHRYRYELAHASNLLGVLLVETDRLPEAERAYQEALTLSEPLATGSSAMPEYRRELAQGYNNRGNWLARSGKTGEALAELNKAHALFKQLAADYSSSEYRRDLEMCAHDRGMVWLNVEKTPLASELLSRVRQNFSAGWFQGKSHDAEQAFQEALYGWHYEKLADDLTREPEYHRAVAES
jgi:tetratricopeptide (TPR) repeat protein